MNDASKINTIIGNSEPHPESAGAESNHITAFVSGVAETSSSLLERLQLGTDEQAWARFVEIYTPVLFSWARSTGLNETDAADLLQEVFLTLLHKLPEFHYDQKQGKFRHWLRVLTLNKLRDLRRKKQATLIGTNLDFVVPSEAELERLWEQEFLRHLASQALQIIRRDFEETSWKACWETTFGGRSVNDVAQELGISSGAVYIARCRVLRKLKQEMDGMWE